MKYSLITKSPLALARKPIAGKPISRTRDNLTGVKAPTGCKYVPNQAMPSEAPQDGFRWTRKLTLTEYGWEEVAIPVEDVTPEDATQGALKAWWASLPEADQVTVYKNAQDALLAWERGEINVMIQLILTNEAPELATLKAQVAAMLE